MIALALFRFLARTPWSTAMALVGMALGVTSIVSVHLVSTSVSERLDGLVPQSLAGYSHYLHRDALQSSDYFSLRRQWRTGQYPQIESLSPIVDDTATVDGNTVRVLGTDLLGNLPVTEDSRNDAAARQNDDVSGNGANPTTDSNPWIGVWIDQSLEGQLSIPVNGIITAPEGTLLADISVAHDLLGWQPERLSYIGIALQDPFAESKDIAEQLLPGFGAGFPSALPNLDLPLGWQLISTAEQYPAREFGKSILFNISALGMLALLVAWLLIYQVAISWLRRLWPVFDRLHVLGVEWHILRRYFLISLGVVAALAAGLGLLLGWWLAKWLLVMAVPGQQPDLIVDEWVVLKAVGSALVVCLLGGIWAFQPSRSEATATVVPAILPTLITLTLIAIAGWCVLQPSSGLAGGFFAIAVLSLASAQLVAPLIRRLKSYASMIKGSYLIRIGIREALWHPKELSVAISGLSLAIATSIGVALMVDSFRSDFSHMLDHRLSYDVVAEAEPELLNQLAKSLQSSHMSSDSLNAEASSLIHSLIERQQAFKQTELRVKGVLVSLNSTQMDAVETQRYQFHGALNRNEVLLSEQASKALNVETGEQIEINDYKLTVAGVFPAFGDLQPRIIVGRDNPLSSFKSADLSLTSMAFMSHDPQALVNALRDRFPKLELRLQSEVRRIALDTFDQTFAITKVLITIAMLVAAISVYIAVTTLRLNRRTGTALLTTLGTTPFERMTLNVSLGLGLGFVAILIAIPLGFAFGWILCSVINPRAFGWTIELQISIDAIFYSCFWGMIAALAAGLLQAGSKEEGVFGAR